MFFLSPTYLWGLLGLLVPIAIHLWSRREGKVVKVGSIQLLTAATSKRSSSISPNELWLLLLRLILLALLVCLISEPRIREEQPKSPLTYIVEPTLLANDRVRSIIDTLDPEVPIRLFQQDFPTIDLENEQDFNPEYTPDYWQLAQEIHHVPADSIIVFINGYVKGLKGKRPEVHKNVNWMLLNQENSNKTLLKAIRTPKSVSAYFISGDPYHIAFSKESISKKNSKLRLNESKDSIVFRNRVGNQIQPIQNQKEIGITLIYEEERLREMKHCKAAFQAIAAYLNVVINVDVIRKEDTTDFLANDLIVWLSQDQYPKTSSKLLTYRPDSLSIRLVKRGRENNVYHITKPLATKNSLAQHFSETLIEILDIHQEDKQNAIRYDKRVVALEEFIPLIKNDKVTIKTANALNIAKPLWWIFGFLLIGERMLAKYRKQ